MSMINRHPVMSYLIAAAGVVLAGLSPWWLDSADRRHAADAADARDCRGQCRPGSAAIGPGLFATIDGPCSDHRRE